MSEVNFFQKYKDLFPTKLSFVIFISYMALFINQGKFSYCFIDY
jgi:hypothetical protein